MHLYRRAKSRPTSKNTHPKTLCLSNNLTTADIFVDTYIYPLSLSTAEPPVYADVLMDSLRSAAAAVAAAALGSAAAIEFKTHGHACAAGELQVASAAQLDAAVVVASSFFSNPDALFTAFWLQRPKIVIVS